MRLFEGTEFDIPPRCDRCSELEQDCLCKPNAKPAIPPEQQTLKLVVEKRKRGKTMTVVRGHADDPKQISELLTKLKNQCGGGGTTKNGVIEIQGSHAERIRNLLTELGYRVR